ncbi:hypothetical protein MASR1M8_25600 [Thermomonas brevis]
MECIAAAPAGDARTGWRGRWWVAAIALAVFLLGSLSSQAGEWRYTVRKGENLWTISNAHLTGPRWVLPLQRLNGILDPLRLVPGSEIRVPLAWTRRTAAQARFESLAGAVAVEGGGGRDAANLQTRVGVGDVLHTGRDGHATLRYPDGSVTRIFPDSVLKVEELEMLGASAQLVARLDLRQGRSESIVRPGSVVRRSDVQVSTPFSTTSVRGTHFRVSAMPEDGIATTGVLEGKVAVADARKPSHALALPAGEGVRVGGDAGGFDRRPLLQAPAMDGIEPLQQQLPLRVEAGAVAGAAAYRGELATDADFNHVVASTMSADAALVYPDVPDGDYYLRLRAVDEAHIEGLDAVARITLDARPEPPFLMQPAAGGNVTAGQPEFTWATNPQAEEYRIEVYAADADGEPVGAPIEQIASRAPKARIALAADDGPRALAWRARVKSRDGELGPFGPVAAFTLLPPGPAMGEAGVDGSTVTLGWGKQAHARQWRFEMAADDTFAAPLQALTTDQPGVKFKRPGPGRYFVRIAWIDAQGRQGPWGEVQQFEVPRKPPYWLLLPVGWLLLL